MFYAPDFIFITDSKRVDAVTTCKKLPAGSAVILRDYDMPQQERENLALSLQNICKLQGLLLLIGKTPELARKINADGVHLPEFMAKQACSLRRKNPAWLITAAAHSRIAAYKAAMAGADAVLISPVFATASHPNITALGIHRAKNMVLPYIYSYALGGVAPADLKILKSIGFQGVAAVSGYK